jgi:hypothetical protein
MDATLSCIYQHDPSIVSRLIAGETILVPIRRNVGDLESIYTLNETGARVWGLIDGQRSLAEVIQQIVFEFDIDEVQASDDVIELTENLIGVGALITINS